jgi:hypothetical protein
MQVVEVHGLAAQQELAQELAKMEGLDRADVARALKNVRAAQPPQDAAVRQPQTAAAGAQACACASCGRQLELRCPDLACDMAGASAAAHAAGKAQMPPARRFAVEE